MRVMKHIAAVATVFSVLPVLGESAVAGSDPIGIWMNDTGRGAVEIKACGNALCGNVVWVKSAADASGCGKPVIGDVKSVGGGRWDNGWIFSPEKGRKYDVELTPLANGNLKVMGYAGMKFLSKTMIWKPAPADLQLCGGSAPAAKPANAAASTSPVTTASIPAPKAEAKTAAAETAQPAPQAKTTEPAPQAKATTPEPAKAAPKNDETAAAEPETSEGDGGNDIAGALGKIKIGDMSLDKVLTKTKSGKCKLDLPWFKVTLNCPQE